MRMPCVFALGVVAMTLAGCADMGAEMASKRAMSEPVANPQGVGLTAPPKGYAWYRDSGEYILAAKLSGRVLRSQPAPKELARSVDGFGYVEH
jgi:hypothetical protein